MIRAKLIKKFDIQEFPKKDGSGNWQKMNFLIEAITGKKICGVALFENCNVIGVLDIGSICDFDFDIESRESKDGRWFTDAVLKFVKKVEISVDKPIEKQLEEVIARKAVKTDAEEFPKDDLPF